MPETIILNVDENSLRVELISNSEFLKGKHRIFLVNVIGLNPSDRGSGYYIDRLSINTTDTIVELVEYFKEEGATVSFNKEGQDLVETFDESSQNFEEAKISGMRIKKRPPIKI